MPDDDRWAAALDELHRGSGRGRVDGRVHLRWARGIVAVAAAVTGLAVVLLVLLLWRDDPSWRSTAGGTAGGLAAVLSGGGALLGWGSAAFRTAWPAVLGSLDRAQRREVTAQLRGRAPGDPARRPLVRALARYEIAQLPLFLLLTGLQLGRIGLEVDDGGSGRVLDVVLTAVLGAVLGVLTLRAHRSARFLRDQPEPVAG